MENPSCSYNSVLFASSCLVDMSRHVLGQHLMGPNAKHPSVHWKNPNDEVDVEVIAGIMER